MCFNVGLFIVSMWISWICFIYGFIFKIWYRSKKFYVVKILICDNIIPNSFRSWIFIFVTIFSGFKWAKLTVLDRSNSISDPYQITVLLPIWLNPTITVKRMIPILSNKSLWLML